MTTVTIPNSVTTIEGHAFYQCAGLISVAMGSGLTYIGNCIFNGCTALAEVNSLITVAPAMSNSGLAFDGSVYSSATLIIPIGGVGVIPVWELMERIPQCKGSGFFRYRECK